ncbi:hypothetical protein EXS56_00660 [Candidatus Kaiserbacteria bacterium]|nr:hypothetical protein [Candidatus Kaiserbacteria bacterium]
MPPPDRNEVRNEIKMQASTTARGAVDIACVAAAVAAREAALGTAASTNAQALTSAYSTRASALASAYSQTGNETIKKAVKSSWANFGAALRLAQKSWKSAQKTAWTNFKTALKSCGPAAAAVADTSNASADEKAGAGSD